MWQEDVQEERETLYETLEVGMLASIDEIRTAWRKSCLRHHPDRHPDDQQQAAAKFQAVQHAWEVLKDSTRRAEYDKALLHRVYLEEYLRRFRDLILTASGLELPLEHDTCILFPRSLKHLAETPCRVI